MHRKSSRVGAHEAKTRLPELLRAVQAGARFTITRRGKPVAELVPLGITRRQSAATSVKQMKDYLHEHAPVESSHLEALIEKGRD